MSQSESGSGEPVPAPTTQTTDELLDDLVLGLGKTLVHAGIPINNRRAMVVALVKHAIGLGEPSREPTLEEIVDLTLAFVENIAKQEDRYPHYGREAGVRFVRETLDPSLKRPRKLNRRARLSSPTPEVSRMEPFPLEREADE